MGTEKEGLELPPISFAVERGKIKEFVRAIGDPNPIYVDPEAARAAGYRDVIAPPTFGVCAAAWGGPDFETLCRLLEVNPLMVLHGEQEFEYFGEINPGDELLGRTRVTKVLRKKGRSGAMNFFFLETVYENQRGEKVLVARKVLVERLEGGEA